LANTLPQLYTEVKLIQGNTLKCNKCLQQGHKQYECPNQWTCRQCNKPGHRESECHEDLNETSQQEEKEENQSVIDDQSNDVG
jgi:Zn ribbon nucleic-acid-binding protein